MKKKTIILMLILVYTVLAKEIAITFDDMPIVRQGNSSEKMEKKIFYDVLKVLDKYNIKAAGFVVGRKIKKKYHKELLQEFINRGHIIGNHSFTHPDLNKNSIEFYKNDILKCEEIIKPYIKGIKYFRYPMLRRGDLDHKKQAIYSFLKKKGYEIASVSIDNDEYTFNVPARKAFKINDKKKLQLIKKQYLEHMQEKIEYFEELSQKKIGRKMKHILLLHLNFLNSLYLDDLIKKLKKNKWKFITLNEALKDPVYNLKDDYCGKKGLGWLERIK